MKSISLNHARIAALEAERDAFAAQLAIYKGREEGKQLVIAQLEAELSHHKANHRSADALEEQFERKDARIAALEAEQRATLLRKQTLIRCISKLAADLADCKSTLVATEKQGDAAHAACEQYETQVEQLTAQLQGSRIETAHHSRVSAGLSLSLDLARADRDKWFERVRKLWEGLKDAADLSEADLDGLAGTSSAEPK
jgi:chromosome segregation ATPase